MRITEFITEVANPRQQAAIAIHKKEQGVAEEGYGTHPSQRVDPRTGKKYVPPKSPLGKGVAEATGDKPFDNMMKNISKGTNKQKTADRKEQQKQTQQRARDAFGNMFGGGNPADKLKIREQGVEEGENWSKHNHKRVGGMSDKSVKSYRRSHPGSKIQTAVTTKPSKIKKGSKDSKRRASFCARMRGMKKHNTSAKTAHDPDSNINKSLRRWHCESIEQLQELVMLAEQKIRNLKK